MEKGKNMVINQVFLGIGVIDVSSDDNFGLVLENNINVMIEFETSVDGIITTTHIIMHVGTSVSKKSLAINCEMFQEM